MSFFAAPLRQSLRALSLAVAVAFAVPVALAAGAALPGRAIVAGVALGVFVGAVARTGMWVAGTPSAERANALAVASGLAAGVVALTLGLLALAAGPAVLVAPPLCTGAALALWWVVRDAPRRCA